MSSNICYEKDSNQRDNVDRNDVYCDIQGKRQTFQNSRVSKGREEQQYTKYVTGREDPGDYYPPQQIYSDDSRAQCFDGQNAYKARSPRSVSPTRRGSPTRRSGSPTRRRDSRISPKPPSQERERRGRFCVPDDRFAEDTKYGTRTLPEHCFERPLRRKCQPCTAKTKWQSAKYCRDDCGSGIVPLRYNYNISKRIWCRTPLTTYQASHGELGRQILCGEKEIKRLINDSGPPCNICEYILPPCRGYYRRYDCVNPCEDESENIVFRDGRNRLRDKVERYWQSCFAGKAKQDVNTYAPQNMALAIKYRKKAYGLGGTTANCW